MRLHGAMHLIISRLPVLVTANPAKYPKKKTSKNSENWYLYLLTLRCAVKTLGYMLCFKLQLL